MSNRPGSSQTVSAPTLVVSSPSSSSSAARPAATSPSSSRRSMFGGSRRGNGTLPSVAMMTRASRRRAELADGTVDDAQATDAHARADRLVLGRPQDHRNHGARWAVIPRRRDDRGGARDRAQLSRTVNHHAIKSVPSD